MKLETIIKLEAAASRHPLILQIAKSVKSKTLNEAEGMEMILNYLLDLDQEAVRYSQQVDALLDKQTMNNPSVPSVAEKTEPAFIHGDLCPECGLGVIVRTEDEQHAGLILKCNECGATPRP